MLMVLLVELAFNASAQNLIVNGYFDNDINNWDFNHNNASWVSDDGASISGNGSFRFGFILSNNASRWSASEPVSVTPGYTYEVAVSLKKPSSSAANYVGTLVYWYDSSLNLIGQEYFTSEVVPFPDDIWQDTYAVFKAPESAVQAVIRLTLSVGGSGNPDEAYALWDDVIMLEDSVFNSNFESCQSSINEDVGLFGCN